MISWVFWSQISQNPARSDWYAGPGSERQTKPDQTRPYQTRLDQTRSTQTKVTGLDWTEDAGPATVPCRAVLNCLLEALYRTGQDQVWTRRLLFYLENHF